MKRINLSFKLSSLLLVSSLFFVLFLPHHAKALDPVRFVVTGDSRGESFTDVINSDILVEIVEAIDSENPDFVLFTGDLVYGADTYPGPDPKETELKRQFQLWLNEWENVPYPVDKVYSIRGRSHDTSTGALNESWDEDAWRDKFKWLLENGPAGESQITYSFEFENIFIVGLDTNITNDRRHTVNQDWLNQQFLHNTKPHVFVFAHEPAFQFRENRYGLWGDVGTNNTAPQRDAFWQSLTYAGGRVYFAGHEHLFDLARIGNGDGNEENDVYQMVVGTAGAPLKDFQGYDDFNHAPYEPQDIVGYEKEVFGYLLVEVDGLDVTTTWKHRDGTGNYVADPGYEFSYTASTLSWIAYNDLCPLSSVNAPNVTEHTYESENAHLSNFQTGDILDKYHTGYTFGGFDPQPTGTNITNTLSDAYMVFNGIVDLIGNCELDQSSWQNIVEFDNLNPYFEYSITLTANHGGYDPDNSNILKYLDRYTKVTIEGAEAFTPASSAGVVTYADDQVSFCTGHNSDNGYVARWVGVKPGEDGLFQITSELDTDHPGTKSYAMSAYRLEEHVPECWASSEETASKDRSASMACDGDPETFWHSQWSDVDPMPDYDHWFVRNLGSVQDVGGIRYYRRNSEKYNNGMIKEFDLYVSVDRPNPVINPDGTVTVPNATLVIPNETFDGTFSCVDPPGVQPVEDILEDHYFTAVSGQYITLVAKEPCINGQEVAAMTELEALP